MLPTLLTLTLVLSASSLIMALPITKAVLNTRDDSDIWFRRPILWSTPFVGKIGHGEHPLALNSPVVLMSSTDQMSTQ